MARTKATCRNLTRIMNYLSDYGNINGVCKTKIAKSCGLLSHQVDEALLWLVKNNIVIKSSKHETKVYRINDMFLHFRSKRIRELRDYDTSTDT